MLPDTSHMHDSPRTLRHTHTQSLAGDLKVAQLRRGVCEASCKSFIRLRETDARQREARATGASREKRGSVDVCVLFFSAGRSPPPPPPCLAFHSTFGRRPHLQPADCPLLALQLGTSLSHPCRELWRGLAELFALWVGRLFVAGAPSAQFERR
jgi:hypothetical protein